MMQSSNFENDSVNRNMPQYEELVAGVNCPTCNGTGKVPRVVAYTSPAIRITRDQESGPEHQDDKGFSCRHWPQMLASESGSLPCYDLRVGAGSHDSKS